jgi:hypothetical protein
MRLPRFRLRMLMIAVTVVGFALSLLTGASADGPSGEPKSEVVFETLIKDETLFVIPFWWLIFPLAASGFLIAWRVQKQKTRK